MNVKVWAFPGIFLIDFHLHDMFVPSHNAIATE
jgi:hypothetical protein